MICSRAAEPQRVIDEAMRWLGTPYHDQASVRGVGCDCLGLARGVWRAICGPEPIAPPPYSRDWGQVGARETFAEAIRPFMIEIDPTDITPGALMLFRMREGAPAKHCGILLHNDQFIHAYERTGVAIFPLDRGWRRRIAYAFTFPESI